MDFFKKLLNAVKKPEPQSAESILCATPASEAIDQSTDPLHLSKAEQANLATREASAACLDRHWQSLGTCESDVLGYMISPSLMGGPDWPSTRQAFRIVRRPNTLLLTTEGLSDPFDGVEGDDLGNGFEMELFIETADIPAHAQGPLGDVSPFAKSWAFELLRHVANTVAEAGGITHQLQQHGVLSLELPGFSESHFISDQLPAHFATEDDCVGVLIGGPAPDFPTRLEDMPLSPVSLVPVVLISAAELEYVRNGGRAAREDLVTRLNNAGLGHVVRLERTSLV
ncbi:Suppressor of fused protein (SUFU) [Pseudomonas sp. Fl5BN2]|uniref:suppressor of fused domain protein n=1 Tax=Pseudomonas sp. Fl5BN2 TaxID=2697652 RepID=UPI00137701AD|nr:suppressor of fused domain protein [Pseudomonas sp. Fl5BN2]NBF02198.1 Suppressor of fused protein (SUFU) [Pseudomonas sp. Fl5BN2]